MTNKKRFEKFVKSARPSARVIAILIERGALPRRPPWVPITVGEGAANEIPSKVEYGKPTDQRAEGEA